jgi:hypothetical protein
MRFKYLKKMCDLFICFFNGNNNKNKKVVHPIRKLDNDSLRTIFVVRKASEKYE